MLMMAAGTWKAFASAARPTETGHEKARRRARFLFAVNYRVSAARKVVPARGARLGENGLSLAAEKQHADDCDDGNDIPHGLTPRWTAGDRCRHDPGATAIALADGHNMIEARTGAYREILGCPAAAGGEARAYGPAINP